ncbi:MAG: YicC family protein [Syntrophales bacterium]|nr:YicC family protein [Syntrophales bacterium]
MIASMTGYGRSEDTKNGRKITVEMKSLNHRFLEVAVRLPAALSFLEPEVKKKVAESLSRGRVEVAVRIEGTEEGEGGLELNITAARRYYDLLLRLKDELGLSGEVDLAMMSSLRDVLVWRDAPTQPASLWRDVEVVLDDAVGALSAMRLREGGILKEDLAKRMESIEVILEEIAKRTPEVVLEYRQRLIERIRELAAGIEIDEGRLCQEVAIMAEKSDITEEIVRLRSHIAQFSALLNEGGAVGRGLDFLLQEINREVNTIGSKSNDAVLAKHVVALKGELAKVREQVQNIE